MQIITISNKETLLAHYTAIDGLFIKCFESQLSQNLWRWLYIENPAGQPIVSLCYDAGVLVGHYAIVPMPLVTLSVNFNSYLSVTTMVAPSHRSHGIFVTLGESTYEKAKEIGVDFIMGFPNKLATPGRKKRLKWNLPIADYVASFDKSSLIEAASELNLVDKQNSIFDMKNETTRHWRLSRPGAKYVYQDGVAYKEFGNAIDLIYFDSLSSLRNLPEEKKINILIPGDVSALCKFKVFDYQFGGISINKNFDPSSINRQMCLSDVF